MAMEGFLPLPPFLTKTFDMVDDSLTDAVVSWSPTCDSSFVVWDFYEFSRTLLPLFFKHSNFSSFVRQLNTYGFRKSQPDRWEFCNGEFRKGQRHRLKNIARKRPDMAKNAAAMVSSVHPFAYVGMPLEQSWNGAGSYHQAAHGVESESEKQLRCEMNEIKLELLRLDSKHQAAHHQMKYLSDYQHNLEMRQQQIVAVVARTLCAPALLYQYVNHGIAADHIQAQQRLLEEGSEMVDGNSNEARKRPCIRHTDFCALGSQNLIKHNQRQLQLEPRSGEECTASCDTNVGTAAVMASGNDDCKEMFSYDQKQMSFPKKCGPSMCLSNEVEGSGNTAANFYHSMAITEAEDGESSAFRGSVEDVKMEISMTQPAFEGHGFNSEADEHLHIVDLNLQLFNLTDSMFPSAGMQIDIRESQVSKCKQAASFSNNFDELESELFWEHLLSPAISCGDFSGSRSACALVDYPGFDG